MSPDPESHDYDPRLFYPMPMEKQPEALRLADVLDLLWMDGHTPQKAAAELRRLHSVNAQLLEALEFVMTATGEQLSTAFEQAQDAIAAAKEHHGEFARFN